MAIKLPDPGNGIPEQKTGNDEWTNMKIVRDNFADQSNAASRLVGTASGQIPLAQDVHKALYSNFSTGSISDLNDAEPGSLYSRVRPENAPNSDVFAPSGGTAFWKVSTESTHPTDSRFALQIAKLFHANYSGLVYRQRYTTTWYEWRAIGDNYANYSRTTSSNANVHVDGRGRMLRATSSMKYKDLIAQLELDDSSYNKAMAVKPIVFRSKSDNDPESWHYLSFSAEELGEHEPALTQWKTHDYDEDGNLYELEEKEAEGINLNAICAVLHATNIYQGKKIEELEQRLTALESNNEPIE